MTDKKKPAAPEPEEQKAEATPAKANKTTASPISTTGATHVYRTDLGESLPAQKPAGVE